MEDDLKILKVEYISTGWTSKFQKWNLPQILKSSSEDQTKIGNLLKLTLPLMEDDLKIIKC